MPYITKDDFNKIEKALALYSSNPDKFKALSKEEQDIIIEADVVMVNLCKKRKRDNERTAEYIAEKRKTDKNYARSKKEVSK